MIQKKISGEITLTVNNFILFDTEVEIFNSLKNPAINRNSYTLNPLLSTNGLAQSFISGNIIGTAGFNHDGSVLITNLTNTGYISIRMDGYPYNSLLEWLKTASIKVGKVKITCTNAAQLRQEWKFFTYLPNGQVIETPIDNTNIISPEQVQNNIAVFNLNKIITKYNGIKISMLDQTSMVIYMEFQEI